MLNARSQNLLALEPSAPHVAIAVHRPRSADLEDLIPPPLDPEDFPTFLPHGACLDLGISIPTLEAEDA